MNFGLLSFRDRHRIVHMLGLRFVHVFFWHRTSSRWLPMYLPLGIPIDLDQLFQVPILSRREFQTLMAHRVKSSPVVHVGDNRSPPRVRNILHTLPEDELFFPGPSFCSKLLLLVLKLLD